MAFMCDLDSLPERKIPPAKPELPVPTKILRSATLAPSSEGALRHGRKEASKFGEPCQVGSAVSLYRTAGFRPRRPWWHRALPSASQLSLGFILCDLGGCGNCGAKDSRVLTEVAGPHHSPGREAAACQPVLRAPRFSNSGIDRRPTHWAALRLRRGTTDIG